MLIQNWIHGVTDDPERLRLAFALLVGTSILLALVAVYYLVTGLTNPLRKRISAVTGKTQARVFNLT